MEESIAKIVDCCGLTNIQVFLVVQHIIDTGPSL